MNSEGKQLIMDRTTVSEGGCWEWSLNIMQNGYASFQMNGEVWYAHRFSYTAFVGDIPDGVFVCHKCDNPKCANPEHLFLGTQLDNMRDAAAKGRIATGHDLPQTKLNEQNKRQIKELREMGLLYRHIGPVFGITRHRASQIYRGVK